MSFVAQPEPATTRGFADARRQFQALTFECGVFSVATKLVSISGRDRVRWLNGMVTNNIRDLATGRGVYAFVLTPQGHIQGDLYVFNEGERLVAEIESSQIERLLATFRRYIIMDKVEIEVVEGTAVIGLVGPQSPALLRRLGFSSEIDPLVAEDASWEGAQLRRVRLDHPALPCYQLWVAVDRAEALVAACAQHGATPVDGAALETLRIVSGIPKLGQDIGERDLPQETGQERALHFSKGCYIGQEIVERIRSRGAVHRRFTGWQLIEGPCLSAGMKIQRQGKEIGEITSVAEVPPESGRVIGLGYVRKEAASEDGEFQAGDAKLKLASLPFREFLAAS